MGVLFTHAVGYREVSLPAAETGPKLRNTNCQTAKNAKNSNDEDECDRFPCDSEL